MAGHLSEHARMAAMRRCLSNISRLSGSQQLLELFRRKPGIVDDTAHCIGVDLVMAGDREDSHAIAQHRVFALPDHPETHFCQGADCF